MEPRPRIDPARFLSQIEASRKPDIERLFNDYYEPVPADERTVAAMRRRRRSVSNDAGTGMKTVSLVEEDGTLYWRDGMPARPIPQARRRRAAQPPVSGSLVLTRTFAPLAPNRVTAAIGAIDRRLNTALDDSLAARMRQLRRAADGTFSLAEPASAGPYTGRTLLFVHGTFSNATNMLGEFTAEATGRALLNRAMTGGGKYDRVLFFEHPTLSVSPVINALELGRALAGSRGQIDVIAHSRGGLVVRWWLEAFGNSLKTAPDARVRAVLAGSPLYGTSLAAPDRIQHAMSLLSNIGTFAEKSLTLVGTANPFLWVAGKLIEVIVSVAGALAKAPVVDALAAIVPGLCGQSRVSNNYELNRLRVGPVVIEPEYYAVESNFETKNPGWQFWKNFRKDRLVDAAADYVFPDNNDLVVDTESMTNFGVPKLKLAGPPCDFGTSEKVWHCNYFRQPESIAYIAECFKLALN